MHLIQKSNIIVNTVYIMFSVMFVCLVEGKVLTLQMYIIETVLLMKVQREKSNKYTTSNGRSF